MDYPPDDSVKKFAAECERLAAVDIGESIDNGPDLLILGVPAAAPNGLVAIATSPTQTMYVRTQDVRGAEADGGQFLVRVRRDAVAFVREEQAIRLTPSPDCGCGRKDGAPSTALKVGAAGQAGGGNTGPIILDCTLVCGWEVVCGTYTHRRTGARIQICFPMFRCHNPCTEGGILV